MVRYAVWPEGATDEAITANGRWSCEWAVFDMGNRELILWVISGFRRLPRRICCQPLDSNFRRD